MLCAAALFLYTLCICTDEKSQIRVDGGVYATPNILADVKRYSLILSTPIERSAQKRYAGRNSMLLLNDLFLYFLGILMQR